MLITAALLSFVFGSTFLQAAELRDVREAVLDTLRETSRSEFPADGVLLRVSTPAPVDVKTWNFRTGVPFGVGALSADDRLELFQGDRKIPAQTEVLATWGPPDNEFGNAVKWLGIDFVDSVSQGEPRRYRLKLVKSSSRIRENSDGRSVTGGILANPATTIKETDHTNTIDNGRLALVINKATAGGFNLFESASIDGRQVIATGQCQGAYIVDGKGRAFWARQNRTARVDVELQGPLAAVVRAEGWFVNPEVKIAAPPNEPRTRPAGGSCRFVTRIYVAAGQPDVRVQHTFVLTEDSDTTTYRDIGIALPVGAEAKATYGGVAGVHDGHTFLLQQSMDKFTVNRIGCRRDSEDQPLGASPRVTPSTSPREPDARAFRLMKGERSDGWVAAGPLAVGVRDFWLYQATWDVEVGDRLAWHIGRILRTPPGSTTRSSTGRRGSRATGT